MCIRDRLCAMCHHAIAQPCERCSLLVCGECGCEGGHESYCTRFRIQLSLGASLAEADERSVSASSETTDPERSVVVRSSTYSYGGLPWRCIHHACHRLATERCAECPALLCPIHVRCIAHRPVRRVVCCNCLITVPDGDRRVQEDMLLLACPRSIARDARA